MTRYKEVLRISGAFVGVLVGAGFASGQEIMQFFTSFGLLGLLGAVIASGLFMFLAMALSTLGQKEGATSHKSVIHSICGRLLGPFVDLMVTFFMFAVAVVMLAGAGALLEQLAGIPQLWGSIAVTVLTVIIVCMNIRQVIGFIGSITPLLLVTVLIVAAATVFGRDADVDTLQAAAVQQPQAAENWLIAALLYVSYNIVAGAPFLVIMGGQAVDRKTALLGGVFGGLLLGLLMLMIAGGMYSRVNGLGGIALPMLLLAGQLSPILGVVMGVAIFGMILNTAVGVLYSLCVRIAPHDSPRFRWVTIAAGALAFLCSLFGFIQLVGTVYPVFGYLGFILMACTRVAWFRTGRNA